MSSSSIRAAASSRRCSASRSCVRRHRDGQARHSRRPDALARHFRMSCARYHCDSQRRQGREGACAAAKWQRRCTSRDIILRSPVACTAHHELPGLPSSAPTRASRRVGRRNQPARRDTLAARMSKAQHCIQRHAESRQGPVRASAGANPQDPARKYHVTAAQSFIRNASSEDGRDFALFELMSAANRRKLARPGRRGLSRHDAAPAASRKFTRSAQRRPGPQPRRHDAAFVGLSAYHIAQRRPGPQPRRHSSWPLPRASGVALVAQRRPGPQPRRHSDARQPRIALQALDRSTKAGASTPATLELAVFGCVADLKCRSTKAGASTPATRALMAVLVATTRPTPAQRRPGPQPRRHPDLDIRYPVRLDPRRSTKAGASTPATRADGRSCWPGSSTHTLNEGRGLNPGDTSRYGAQRAATTSALAQRRPGPQPRRHWPFTRAY